MEAAALDATLKEHFGYDSFRPGQREVALAALEHRDVAVFWTTGAGKSLCYQLPAVQSGKTVLVVSPLISLMQDQVHRFNATRPQLLPTLQDTTARKESRHSAQDGGRPGSLPGLLLGIRANRPEHRGEGLGGPLLLGLLDTGEADGDGGGLPEDCGTSILQSQAGVRLV